MLLSDYMKKYRITIKNLAIKLNSDNGAFFISISSLARWRSEGATVTNKGRKIIRIHRYKVLWEQEDE